MSQYIHSPHPKQQTPAMPSSYPNTVNVAGVSSTMLDEVSDMDPCLCSGTCTCAHRQHAHHSVPSAISTNTNAVASSSTGLPIISSASSYTTKSSAPKLPSLKIRLTIPPSLLDKRQPSGSFSQSLKKARSASASNGAALHALSRPSNPSFSPYSQIVPKRRGRPPKALAAARQLGINSSSDAISYYNSAQAARKRKIAASKKSAVIKGKSKKTSAAKRRRVESSDESSSELSDVDTLYRFGVNDTDARSVQFPTFVSASALSSLSDSSADSSSEFDTDSSVEAEEESFIVAEETQRGRGHGQPQRRNPSWVIRPRKPSVGGSDMDMDMDSDATEDEDEQDEEQQTEAGDDDDEDMDSGLRVGAGYIGVATGWSEPEDEESSFDADLFFANLTDSDGDDSHSSAGDEDERADDGDQSDLEGLDIGLEHLPFELTQDWDGQVSFSNGLGEGRGFLDVHFEMASELVQTINSLNQISEVEEPMSTEEEVGYEGGDTTDEELVGEDHLPNEQAMRLFNLPFSVSSINPLSTMSPAARGRRVIVTRDATRPADILSSRVFLDDWDAPDENDAPPSNSSRSNGPREGHFIPVDTPVAIIDDAHAAVPSPHPRPRARRGRSVSHFGRTSPRSSLPRQLSLPPISQPSFQILSSSELTTSPELHPQTMDLDDVLDTAFLDSDPSEEIAPVSPTEQARKHLNLSRWGWGSDTGGSAELGQVMKSSPLSMLWQDKDLTQSLKSKATRAAGDRTPTNANASPKQQDHIPNQHRKETRKERRLKQKNLSLGHERPPHQQHYFRQHHPNSKSRSASHHQRSNFNNSPPAQNL
ncbi:unnamed protein product [Mycena citricolor]|uniref:Uncharacterized protein n=1 Tax=Mycena citricolor TaxID=2018698 RepID=A0AAD2Q420_9AGAR|nr:unnamed protein product [Mycena citricolor]